ncbi:MAG: hypothetical protein ACXADA_01565 [Candidatus Hodarchaeales archaeon]|jgi:hypothetical protein
MSDIKILGLANMNLKGKLNQMESNQLDLNFEKTKMKPESMTMKYDSILSSSTTSKTSNFFPIDKTTIDKTTIDIKAKFSAIQVKKRKLFVNHRRKLDDEIFCISRNTPLNRQQKY